MLASGVSLHRGILNGLDNRTTFYGATQAATPLLAIRELSRSGNSRAQDTVHEFLKIL